MGSSAGEPFFYKVPTMSASSSIVGFPSTRVLLERPTPCPSTRPASPHGGPQKANQRTRSNHRLKVDDVKLIRLAYHAGMPIEVLAIKYGVDKVTIYELVNMHTFAHIPQQQIVRILNTQSPK